MFIFNKNIICNIYKKLPSMFVFLIVSLKNAYRNLKKRSNINDSNRHFIFKRSKTLIIISLTLISFSSSYAGAKEDKFFLKSVGTLSKIRNVREKHTDMITPLVQESSIATSIGVGVGYYIAEDIRLDLILETLRWSFLDQQGNFNDNMGGGNFYMGSRTINRKAYGTSLMLNGYVDILDINTYKIFLGAGGGVVQIKEKVNVATIGSFIDNGMVSNIPSHIDKGSSKTARNITYSLIVGTNVIINPQVNVELMYLWRNFGRLKQKEAGLFNRSSNNTYKGHHLSIGLRYDI